MSETEPAASTAQSEIDVRMAAHAEQKRIDLLDELLLGDGLNHDTGDKLTREQQDQRVEEATEYYKHLEELAKREGSVDNYDAQLLESSHAEALIENEAFDLAIVEAQKAEQDRLDLIESNIKQEPRFRRLLMIAVDLAGRRNQLASLEATEANAQLATLTDKEAKFQELFDWYEGEGMDHATLEYILDKAYSPSIEASNTPQWSALEQTAEESAEAISDTIPTESVESAEPVDVEAGAEVEAADAEAASEEKVETVDALDDIVIDPEAAETVDVEAEETPADDEMVDNLNDIVIPEGVQDKESFLDLVKRGYRTKDLFKPSFWAAEWTTSRALRRHARDEMSPEELDKQKKRNRYILIAGASAVAAVAVGLLVARGIDHSLFEGAQAHSGSGSGTGDIPGTGGSGSTGGGEVDPTAGLNFNVDKGEGGIRLFKQLGLSEADWYKHAHGLLKHYPDSFYDMGSGRVGLKGTGIDEQARKHIAEYLNK